MSLSVTENRFWLIMHDTPSNMNWGMNLRELSDKEDNKMLNDLLISVTNVTEHVLQFAVPTPTLPPSYHTNTYLVYDGSCGVLVDIGTSDPMVLQQLIRLIEEAGIQEVKAILATHYHQDHTSGISWVAQHFQCPIYIHPLDQLPAARILQMPIEHIIAPPETLVLETVHMYIEHTPGHTHGHLHLGIHPDGVLLVGDHLAGDGSVWIGPPDGHMHDYYQALEKISTSGFAIAGPGHGPILNDAVLASKTLLHRRQQREQEIYALIQAQNPTLNQIVEALYAQNVVPAAMFVARRTVQAHVQHLMDLNYIERIHDIEKNTFYYTSVI